MEGRFNGGFFALPRYYGLLVRECCKEVAKFGPKLVMLERLLLGFCRSAFLVTWSKRWLVSAGLHAQRLVTAMRFDLFERTSRRNAEVVEVLEVSTPALAKLVQ